MTATRHAPVDDQPANRPGTATVGTGKTHDRTRLSRPPQRIPRDRAETRQPVVRPANPAARAIPAPVCRVHDHLDRRCECFRR